MIILLNDTQDKLYRHAQEDYPNECCGILIGQSKGRDKTVLLVYPVANSAGGGKNTHFRIDPPETMRAEMYAEQKNLEIVGFYHSHPDNEAVASAEDIRFMIPGYSYPIISVRNGSAVEMRCYEKSDDTKLREEPIKRRDTNADNSLCRGNASGICE